MITAASNRVLFFICDIFKNFTESLSFSAGDSFIIGQVLDENKE